MKTETPDFDFSQQLAILLKHGVTADGRRLSVTGLAVAAGLNPQTLINLLANRSTSPLLETARAVCDVYGISLDYFDLSTAEACKNYLNRHRQPQPSEALRKMIEQLDQLTSPSKEQIARVVHWISRFNDAG